MLVILVSTTFLVQNQYYALQVKRSLVQDNARMVTEIVARDVRTVMPEGMLLAQNKNLAFRSPILLGVVCARKGSQVSIHFEGGEGGVDTLEVGGVAALDQSAGTWDYNSTDWKTIKGSGGRPAADCADNGADTTGASSEYIRLKKLNSVMGGMPSIGDILMLYREVELQFATSVLDTTQMALYRGNYGDVLVEFASGMDATAQFLYRKSGSSTYNTSVPTGQLDQIDAVRIVAQARTAPETGGEEDVTFGWAVNVPLRNVN